MPTATIEVSAAGGSKGGHRAAAAAVLPRLGGGRGGGAHAARARRSPGRTGRSLAAACGLPAAGYASRSPPRRRSGREAPITLALAHRGARLLAPENTLAAARLARQLGADGWEYDVQPTADGAFVLHHDLTLEGSTDAALAFPDRFPWRLVDFTLEEVRRLRVRPPQGQPAEAGEGIPTLEEARALDRQLGWLANVELKLPPGLDGLELGRALGARLEAGEELILSSFQFATLAGARQANPALAVGLLTERPVEDPLALLEYWRAASWHPGTGSFGDEQLRAVLQAGRRVLVWTVNQEQEARRLAGLGVSGIIGDDPGMLARVLKGREA